MWACLTQQEPDLKVGMRSEDSVYQGRDNFYMLASTASASSVQEGRIT